MRTKTILALSFIIILNMFGIAYCQKDNNLSHPVFVKEIESTELKATKITPVIDETINTNENLIFCSTFQMAWNEFCYKYAEGILEINNGPNFVKKLNDLYKQEPLLDEKSYLIMAGFGKEDILTKINEAVKKKFGYLKKDELPPKFAFLVRPNDIVSFAYLYKDLEFAEIFDDSQPILLKNNNQICYVEAFGASENKKLLKQVNVEYFNDDTSEVNKPKGVIISLKTKSETDEIIISTIPVSNNLYESYKSIQDVISHNLLSPNFSFNSIHIPKLNFNILHEYNELCGLEVLNKTLKKYNDRTCIGHAIHKIAMKLNEKGAKVSSYAIITFIGYIDMASKQIVIKPPFIIYLKDKTKELPYFMAYVSNDEVMEKYIPIESNEYGKVDRDISLNPILKPLIKENCLDYYDAERGAQYINDKNEEGSTALLIFIKKRQYILSKFKIGCIRFYQTKNERKLTKYALDLYNKFIKLLIKFNADINTFDNLGNTPLICAVESNDFQAAKILVDAGADIMVKRKDSKDALTIAKEKKFIKIFNLIQAKQKKK